MINSMSEKSFSLQHIKRISLKSLFVNKPLQNTKTIFDQAHIKLKDATFAVFHNQPIPYTLEELYRDVEDVCANKMVPIIYGNLESSFSVYVSELLFSFMDENLQLKKVAQVWELYCKKMLMIRNIYLFLDRQLPNINSKYLSIWELALHLFRDSLKKNEMVQSKIVKQMLEQIFLERKGENIDRQLIRSVVRMHIDLQLYEANFQNPFLDQSQQFYAEEAERLVKELSISDYLQHVNRRLEEEEDRLCVYLDRKFTRSSLINTLDTELIANCLDLLVFKGLSLIRDRCLNELRLLYSLLSRVAGGIDNLRNNFRQHVKQIGLEIVENPNGLPEKDRAMIQLLLDCRDSLLELINVGFCADCTFNRALQEAFEDFINSRPNKPAELLAKHLDLHLRTGNKTQTDEELEMVMEKATVLFRFIEGKDIFEAFYTKELAKRLLLGKSASIDAERSILSKLKQECGPNYTRKMETMFQDIELSRQLSKNFRAAQHTPHTIDFTVNVICPASWPKYPQLMVNYPADMLSLREDFTKFYLSHHQGRKLIYEPTLGTCVVRAEFPSSLGVHKELQVSEFQALVLLKFNQNQDTPLSYQQIADETGIEKTQLDRTLLSLAAGKGQKVLIMKPLSIEMSPNHQFYFNSQFQHRLIRIKFNQIQLKETKQEQEDTEERVFADRVAHVDCCIVRIMKTRKTIEHNALLTEVYTQLQFPLKATDVKKRIENLIDRDYMKRDSVNTATYHYLA